jgi:uncharacterized protein (TIGR02117 family)
VTGQRLLRWTGAFAALVLGLVLLWFLAAEALSRLAAHHDYERGEIDIFLISNGWHADLALPMRAAGIDWQADLPPSDFKAADPGAAYVAFGWGDRDFYLETPRLSDLRLGTALRALLGQGRSVLHASYLHPPHAGPEVRSLKISRAAYLRLARSLQQSFARDPAGRPVVIPGRGYGPADAFYEAKGSYSPFLTCNAWMGERLSEAGLPGGVWTPMAGQLLRHWPQSSAARNGSAK